MNILPIIRKYNHTTNTLAKAMGIKQSTLSNALNGNPTLKTLRLMAEKIPCSVAEFFLDELPEDFDLAAWRAQMKQSDQQPVADGAADTLPFGQGEDPTQAPGVFVCPCCGAGVSFQTFVVQKPKEENQECEEK